MTSPANTSKTKSPKSPGLLSRLNCASGKSGKSGSQSAAPLTMAPATPPDLSRSYAEDPGQPSSFLSSGKIVYITNYNNNIPASLLRKKHKRKLIFKILNINN